MGIRDWAKVFGWKKKHSDRTIPSTNQGAPVPVVDPFSPPQITKNEIPTSNPDPLLSPQPLPIIAAPPTNQVTPISVSELVSPPTSLPTITTNQEAPVPDPYASSPPPPPAKTISAGNTAKIVGNGLVVALKLLKEAVTGVGVPGLEATVNGVVGVIDLIKDVRANADDLGDLDRLISNLATAISMAPNLHQGIDLPESLLLRLNRFLSELHGILTEVRQMLGVQSLAIRTANSQAYKEAIEDLKDKIRFLMSRFSTEGILSLELNMARTQRNIQSMDQAQHALVVTQHTQEYENLINSIPRAHARYNDTSTKPSRPCHPGTRTGLLEIIAKWIVEDRDAKPYFWLCGEVGVGKTTVAHTVAHEQQTLQRLGATFFFSRHEECRRNPHLLFTSIAYQLARFDHGFYTALAGTLKPDPDIVKRSPMEQFKQLVLQPLAQSGIDSSRTVVIVIDGLDECSNPTAILDVLAQGIDNVGVRLRVLISSRPYADILSKFKGRRLYHLTNETQFRDINPESLSEDVAAYLSWSLGAVALEADLPSPWPPKDQLDELIRRAAGLFIVASTYTKYIEDPEVGNPKGQLARIISRKRGMGSSPLAELDALYDQILNDLKAKLASDSQVMNAREMVAFVILAPEGINVLALSGLFSADPFDVRLVLRRLTSVILLPEGDDGNIAPFHASFGEYIQDSTRCTVRELSVDTPAAYGRIVIRCFDAMTSAGNSGITGVEYGCTRGYYWTPKHFYHIITNLGFYLSRSPHAQVEEVRMVFTGTRIWTLLGIALHVGWALHGVSEELVYQARKFKIFPHANGADHDERTVSLARLMIDNYASEINHTLENSKTAHEAVALEDFEPNRQQTLKFVVQDIPDYARANEAVRIVQSVRCWMKYKHSTVMSLEGFKVIFGEDSAPQEVLVFIASPFSIQCFSTLHEYLKRNSDLDVAAKCQLALGIAEGLRYLHGSSPSQPHNGISPHQIIVSGEGQPMLYPSTWDIDFQARRPPNNKDGVDTITCGWGRWFTSLKWYHWNPTGGDGWQSSSEARLQVDVWDFGSVLYQMFTGEEPVATYERLAEGNEALDYKPPTQDPEYGTWEDDSWDTYRYETAVYLLSNTLEASKDIKELMKSCWTIRQQDRPPMSEVFERLKAIVEDMRT